MATIYEAVEVLFEARHRLPADVIRSLRSISFCAESALYHEPEGFSMEPKDYAEHDVAECEDENTEHPPGCSCEECEIWLTVTTTPSTPEEITP
jgi:hypothetical protein